METQLNFEGLANALLGRSGDLISQWLPGGKLVGKEYECGDIRGGPGNSFRVNLNTGRWADFASDDKGGDLISLYAAIENIGQGEAAKRLAEQIGFDLGTNSMRPAKQVEHRITRPPTSASIPHMEHPKMGKPSMYWVYKDSGGDLFYVARYETANGKEFCPWSWSATSNRWVAKGWPAPRPVYGLEILDKRPAAPVLVVEGEKAADAARKLLGHAYAVIAWPNGAKAVHNTLWKPIHGRKVLIWPDADGPGRAAGERLAQILSPHCPEIKVVDTEGQPEGWDAANALEEGWDFDRTVAWARPRVKVIAQAVAQNNGAVAAAKVEVTVTTDDDAPSGTKTALWESLGLTITGGGNPHANADNTLRVLESYEPLKNLLWFDEFHQKYFTLWNSPTPREWKDIDEINLMIYLQRVIGLSRTSEDIVHRACMKYAHERIKNEPRDWMDSLVWDGTERCAFSLTDAFGVENNEYSWAASKNFWTGMVARIYRPGCQLDNMLVLEGPQGIGKTNALRAIGGKWHVDTHEGVTGKDFFLTLEGKMLVEIAELDAFRKAELTRIKQVITCTTDRYRTPYGRAAEDHARQCLFVGTTNEKTYLQDESNRRFWPVACSKIDLPWIKDNRDQLFAEAVVRFKRGDTWHEMPVGETMVEQEKRRQGDAWEDVVSDYVQFKSEITMHELAAECLKIEIGKLGKNEQARIARVHRRLGWEKNFKIENGSGGSSWEKPIK